MLQPIVDFIIKGTKWWDSLFPLGFHIIIDPMVIMCFWVPIIYLCFPIVRRLDNSIHPKPKHFLFNLFALGMWMNLAYLPIQFKMISTSHPKM